LHWHGGRQVAQQSGQKKEDQNNTLRKLMSIMPGRAFARNRVALK
jgi:hypothetical protein